MSVSIFSYRGEVTIGLMVDATLVPDPEEILARLEEELDVIHRLPAHERAGSLASRRRRSPARAKAVSKS
jgi:hypothetical protein